jgi:hypothetical protein
LIPVFVRCKVQIAPFVLAPTLDYSLLQGMQSASHSAHRSYLFRYHPGPQYILLEPKLQSLVLCCELFSVCSY